MKLFPRIRALFQKRRLEAEMAEEMRLHRERRLEEHVAAGMSPEEARFAAQRAFGHADSLKEIARAQRGIIWLEQLAQDLRYGCRSLARAPWFTATIVLTLALGLGVNVTVFTFVNALALRSLPVRDPDRLVEFNWNSRMKVDLETYRSTRERNTVFSGTTAWLAGTRMLHLDAAEAAPRAAVGIGGREVPSDLVNVHFVAENYFQVLGGDPVLGRGFLREDNAAPGAPPIIVLHYRFWRDTFQGDPGVLGKFLRLEGKSYTIVGVAAPGFDGHLPAPPIGWAPFMTVLQTQDLPREAWEMVGRLKPGVSLAQAQAELNVLWQAAPDKPVPLRQGMKYMPVPRQATWTLYLPFILAFGMVLAVACTNVANLFLARTFARQREFGVRLTLGAGRSRIVRQLLTENLLLCALATILGFGLAQATFAVVLPALPGWVYPAITRQWQFLPLGIDYRVFGFMATLTCLATLTTGLAPALYGCRTDLVSVTRNLGSFLGGRIRHSRLRNALVVAQTAICLVSLSTAGVALNALWRAHAVGVGFDPRDIFQVAWSTGAPSTPELWRETRSAFARLRQLPGVSSGDFAVGAPLVEGRVTLVMAGQPGAGPRPFSIRCSLVTDTFFRTFGIPLMRGRPFGSEEMAVPAASVVISESAAHLLWPDENPLGKTLAVDTGTFGRSSSESGFRDCQVIGVAADVAADAGPQSALAIYLPLPEDMVSPAYLRLRDPSPVAMAALMREAGAAGIKAGVGRSIAERIEERRVPITVLGWGSGILGGLALAMATVGLAGVTMFTVGQRTHEIGVRLALGASANAVVRLVVGQGMRLVGLGIVLGLVGGVAFTTLFLDHLTNGQARGLAPLGFAAGVTGLAVSAMLACWLPARRAAKVDPMTALRAE